MTLLLTHALQIFIMLTILAFGIGCTLATYGMFDHWTSRQIIKPIKIFKIKPIILSQIV
jgi:hypothetical protein